MKGKKERPKVQKIKKKKKIEEREKERNKK